MIFGILLLIINTVLASVGASGADVQTDSAGSDIVIATTNQALKSIKSAEAANADVSSLVERFNAAIDLQEQAEQGVYRTCPSYSECIVESNNMMLSIVQDSSVIGTQATAKIEQTNVMMFTVYVPLGSFAISVAIVLTFRALASRRTRRYQKMDIHQRSGA